MKSIILGCILLCAFVLNAGAVFTEPTPDQINATVENPAELAPLLNGATPEDAVKGLMLVIDGVVQLGLPDEEQKTRIAQLVAILFKTMPDRAIELAKLIAQKAPIEILPTIVAAAAVVMGNQAAVVTEAFVSGVARENAQMVRNAGTHPETILPAGVVLALGVAVSHTTTAVGSQPTAMPLAPPLTEYGWSNEVEVAVSNHPPVPPKPPVATNYPGQ